MIQVRGIDEIYILTQLGVGAGIADLGGLSEEEKRRILLHNMDTENHKEIDSIQSANEIRITEIWADLLKVIALIVLGINLVIELFKLAYKTSFDAARFLEIDDHFQETYALLLMVHFMHNVSIARGGGKCYLGRNQSCRKEKELNNELLYRTFEIKSTLPDFLYNEKLYDYVYINAVNSLYPSVKQTAYMNDGVDVFKKVKGGEPCVLPLWELKQWEIVYIQIVQKYY